MEEEEEEICAQILTLLDFYWFHHLILFEIPPPSPPPSPLPPDLDDTESLTSSPPPLLRHRHRRSVSDDLSPYPTLQIHPPELQPILSGKESAVGGDETTRIESTACADGERRLEKTETNSRRRKKKKSEGSKSLSYLEFEELKGFMDLGFTFSDAEADPRLMEIVPGLQRLKAAAAAGDREQATDATAVVADASSWACCSDGGSDETAVSRPYLSEAWEVEEESPLRNLRIPVVGGGIDLKYQLRFWAHAVASTVR